MEVHHHSHTARKRWTHYFWEFFMLFLAVTLGFLVENQREHFVEHQRAERFAESICSDLREDTSALNKALFFTANKIKHIDSLIELLHHEPGSWNDTSFSIHTSRLVFFSYFKRNNGTYEQMKSSGSLRYFKQDLIDLLNGYETIAREIQLREETESKVLVEQTIPFVQKVINYEMVATQLMGRAFNKPLNSEVYVKIGDKNTADLMINHCVQVEIYRIRLNTIYSDLFRQANSIITALKKEYHLE